MKRELVVIAGHGAADPGTIRGDLVERELNIAAVLGLNDFLSRTYRIDRPPTLILSPAAPSPAGEELLGQRIARINADFGTDVVIVDLHHNAEASGTGAQVWYSQNAASTPGDETNAVASPIQEELSAVVGEPIPLIRSDRSRFGGLGILDNTLGTALLVELRELVSDVAPPLTPALTYAAGAAIGRALARYFGWPLVAPAVVTTPAPAVRLEPPRTTLAIAMELEYIARELRAKEPV